MDINVNVLVDFLCKSVVENKRLALSILKNPKIAQLADKDGNTVVHLAVFNHRSVALETLKNPEIARLADKDGCTVAHIAGFNYEAAAIEVLKNPEMWDKVKDKSGKSVLQAAKEEILS